MQYLYEAAPRLVTSIVYRATKNDSGMQWTKRFHPSYLKSYLKNTCVVEKKFARSDY